MGLWKPGAGAPFTPCRERRRLADFEASTVMRRRPVRSVLSDALADVPLRPASLAAADGALAAGCGAAPSCETSGRDGALPTPDPCAPAMPARAPDSKASSAAAAAGALPPRLELVDSVITRCA